MEQGRSDENLKQLQDPRQPSPRRVKLPDCQMAAHNHHQPPPSQKCPRCDSSNTKFCYYNNYSLSQPRYFCKACRRYWTHGGTLRNVPVGGGYRKSKRSKPSSSSSSSSEIARIQTLSPALPSQNLTGTISGQSFRTLPPVIPPVGDNSFYTGGTFLSSLAAMQSLPAEVNQVSGVNFGGSHFSANMSLLHGINLPSLRPHAPQQFQAQNELFLSQQSLIPQRPFSSWTQSFINRGDPSSSAESPSFWGGSNVGNITHGGDQAGSSFNPNQCSDNHPGFDPSQ